MDYKDQKPVKVNYITRFLWWAAGGNEEILMRSTHSDRVKYLTLGGIILATGVMAGLAGGYAFYTIFAPHSDGFIKTVHTPTAIMSVVGGFLWGMMIFNIDRFIVTSTGTGDGTETITWAEFKSALPRLVMGAIIAVTISKPVEIRMFQDEINVELKSAKMEKQREFIASLDSIYVQRINGQSANIKVWQSEIDEKEDAYTASEKIFNEELAEKPGGSASGYGPDAKRKEMLMDDRKRDREIARKKYQPLIDKAYANIDDYEKQKQIEIDQSGEIAGGLDGLLQRIKLSHEIAGWTISLFITLLFLAIELTPIFFKLMLIKSPYDYLLENEKELVKANDGIYIEYNYYDENEYPNKQGIERHLVRFLNKERINLEKMELLEAQKRLTKYAIEKFEEEQRKRIDENPGNYINITDQNTNEEDPA